PVGVFLRQLAAEVSGSGVDVDFALAEPAFKLRVAGLDVVRGVSGHHDYEIALSGSAQLMNLGNGVRKTLGQALEVVDKLRTLLLIEERMVFLALLAAELADLGNAQRNNRKRRVDLQRRERRLREC